MDPDLLAHELEKGPERILVSKAGVLGSSLAKGAIFETSLYF